MSRLKRSFLFLITILIMIGVSGCMSVERDINEPIQNYLKEKYDCNFEIEQIDLRRKRYLPYALSE